MASPGDHRKMNKPEPGKTELYVLLELSGKEKYGNRVQAKCQ